MAVSCIMCCASSPKLDEQVDTHNPKPERRTGMPDAIRKQTCATVCQDFPAATQPMPPQSFGRLLSRLSRPTGGSMLSPKPPIPTPDAWIVERSASATASTTARASGKGDRNPGEGTRGLSVDVIYPQIVCSALLRFTLLRSIRISDQGRMDNNLAAVHTTGAAGSLPTEHLVLPHWMQSIALPTCRL